ncbi:MAG: Gfo/Idh/MocA family oxidoreductase [Mesorhizobium sp.]
MTGIAFVGTGYVADYYIRTLANHASLTLCGVYDRAPHQLERFSAYYGVKAYRSLDDLLADPKVEIVANLTTLESHYEISKAALLAGKHVYSEKPMTGTYAEAVDLVATARARGLIMAGAPANAMTPKHAEVARLVADGAIGAPKLAYAQMEDGAVFRQNWRDWRSQSGAPWPGEHEFAIGCTLEHVVYSLVWLVSLLGPVTRVTAFSATCFPDKGLADGASVGPDFSVAALSFRNGAVARLTTGLCADKDRSLTLMGDAGTITVDDLWDFHSTARIERSGQPRALVNRLAGAIKRNFGVTFGRLAEPGQSILAHSSERPTLPTFPSRIDFSRGIAAVADAINGGPLPFVSGEMALHLTEIALAISNAGPDGHHYIVSSTPSADGRAGEHRLNDAEHDAAVRELRDVARNTPGANSVHDSLGFKLKTAAFKAI